LNKNNPTAIPSTRSIPSVSTRASSSNAILIGTSLGENPVCRHFAALGRELINLGYGVTLLADGSNLGQSYVDKRILIARWPSPRPTRLADAIFLNGMISETKPCCLISNFGSNNLMQTVGALRRVPVRIHWYHTLMAQNRMDWRKSWLRARLLVCRAKLVYRLATHTVTNSNAAKQDVVKKFGIAPSRCHLFWNCLDDPSAIGIAATAEPAAVRNKFVCVGRFSPSKGQATLVRAVSLVLRKIPDLEIEFVGEGDYKEECRALAARLGVAQHCLFRGYLPHDEVLRKMAGAQATIVPSLAEAFGLVVIESMAVGVPVIGSRTGGISEIIRDGLDGLLFTTGDYVEMARHIIEMASNRELRLQMATNCRSRFLQCFEMNRMVRLQALWLNQIISHSHSNPIQNIATCNA